MNYASQQIWLKNTNKQTEGGVNLETVGSIEQEL